MHIRLKAVCAKWRNWPFIDDSPGKGCQGYRRGHRVRWIAADLQLEHALKAPWNTTRFKHIQGQTVPSSVSVQNFTSIISHCKWHVSTHVFDNHEVIKEEDQFTFKQLPNGFTSLPLRFLQGSSFTLVLRTRYQLWPVDVLQYGHVTHHSQSRHCISTHYMHITLQQKMTCKLISF